MILLGLKFLTVTLYAVSPVELKREAQDPQNPPPKTSYETKRQVCSDHVITQFHLLR